MPGKRSINWVILLAPTCLFWCSVNFKAIYCRTVHRGQFLFRWFSLYMLSASTSMHQYGQGELDIAKGAYNVLWLLWKWFANLTKWKKIWYTWQTYSNYSYKRHKTPRRSTHSRFTYFLLTVYSELDEMMPERWLSIYCSCRRPTFSPQYR